MGDYYTLLRVSKLASKEFPHYTKVNNALAAEKRFLQIVG
jgi:hypothetical protein